MARSGQCDLIAESDEQAIDLCKQLLEFIPGNCWERPADVANWREILESVDP